MEKEMEATITCSGLGFGVRHFRYIWMGLPVFCFSSVSTYANRGRRIENLFGHRSLNLPLLLLYSLKTLRISRFSWDGLPRGGWVLMKDTSKLHAREETKTEHKHMCARCHLKLDGRSV